MILHGKQLVGLNLVVQPLLHIVLHLIAKTAVDGVERCSAAVHLTNGELCFKVKVLDVRFEVVVDFFEYLLFDFLCPDYSHYKSGGILGQA